MTRPKLYPNGRRKMTLEESLAEDIGKYAEYSDMHSSQILDLAAHEYLLGNSRAYQDKVERNGFAGELQLLIAILKKRKKGV